MDEELARKYVCSRIVILSKLLPEPRSNAFLSGVGFGNSLGGTNQVCAY